MVRDTGDHHPAGKDRMRDICPTWAASGVLEAAASFFIYTSMISVKTTQPGLFGMLLSRAHSFSLNSGPDLILSVHPVSVEYNSSKASYSPH